MTTFAAPGKKARFLTCVALPALAAFANITSANAAADTGPIDIESIVVTGTRFNATIAPAKASLDAMEPQTVINRAYIENFQPPQADYVGILAIAPSMIGTDINGPGFSDTGVKNSLRGIPDGSFAMLYDGIPFGDTNGPSHHSISYFPASTLGSAVVDRGPGNAGNMSAATFGGTIKLFSEPLADKFTTKGFFGYGSFNSYIVDGNLQSGGFGTDPTRILVNVQNEHSDGALTYTTVYESNALIKINHDFGPNWTVTAFGNYSFLAQHLPDGSGNATPAQIATYGKNFLLQGNNPNLPTYYQYNRIRKYTDMEYVREQGSIGDVFKIDNTTYSYQYTNHTFSTTNSSQTQADINAGTAEGLGTIVNGVKYPTDIPGYTKINEYRVTGDIFRTSTDYKIGSVSGQLRAGLWAENNATIRSRYDYDMTKCLNLGLDPFARGFANMTQCQDSSLAPKGNILVADGYAEYNEHSAWYNYEPYAELEIRPIDGLTITPGIKYVDWLHKTNGIEQKLIQYFTGEFTTKKTLLFAEANYKIEKSWSVYAQYAQGIYVPDIGVFENKSGPTGVYPAPETTTNYQLGTVYYADNLSFDADGYYIKVNNNYVSQACNLAPFNGQVNETCFLNTGSAVYKGLEAEATYEFRGALDGFQLFGSGSLNSAKSLGVWLSKAAPWTLAAGVVYLHNGWKFSVIDKAIGPQYMDNNQTQFYKVGSYNSANLSAGYSFGHVELDLQVTNLFDSRHVVSITEVDKTIQANQANSLDQYAFMAPISVMATVKVHY